MSTLEKARAQVREILEASLPDGPLDPEHASKVAGLVVAETLRTLGLREQHTARVWLVGRDAPENMQAPDVETARRVAAEQAQREDADRVATDMRWCSRWHRT